MGAHVCSGHSQAAVDQAAACSASSHHRRSYGNSCRCHQVAILSHRTVVIWLLGQLPPGEGLIDVLFWIAIVDGRPALAHTYRALAWLGEMRFGHCRAPRVPSQLLPMEHGSVPCRYADAEQASSVVLG